MKSEDYLLLSITFAVASVVWAVFNYDRLIGISPSGRSIPLLFFSVLIVLFVVFIILTFVKYRLEKLRKKGIIDE